MLKSASISPLGITNISSGVDNKIRIEAGSFVYENKWVNYKSKIFSLNDYVKVKLKERDSFFNNRGYALYLVICMDFYGKLFVEEGVQVSFKLKESVPAPRVKNIPLVGLILVQNGSEDLNYGFRPVLDSDLIEYSGLGNILEKNLPGITGAASYAVGERGLQGVTGFAGVTGVPGLTGLPGIQGPLGWFFVGSTGVIGVPGLNYNSEYNTGLDIYLKMNDTGETGTDSSGNGRHVAWGATGTSYHYSIGAVLCEGQSVVNLGQESSFSRQETSEYAILTGPGVITNIIALDDFPVLDTKMIMAEFDGVSHSFIFYIDSEGKLNFQDDTYRWVSNSKIINLREWALLEFHKLDSGVGRMYKTTALIQRTEVSVLRITL